MPSFLQQLCFCISTPDDETAPTEEFIPPPQPAPPFIYPTSIWGAVPRYRQRSLQQPRWSAFVGNREMGTAMASGVGFLGFGPRIEICRSIDGDTII